MHGYTYPDLWSRQACLTSTWSRAVLAVLRCCSSSLSHLLLSVTSSSTRFCCAPFWALAWKCSCCSSALCRSPAQRPVMVTCTLDLMLLVHQSNSSLACGSWRCSSILTGNRPCLRKVLSSQVQVHVSCFHKGTVYSSKRMPNRGFSKLSHAKIVALMIPLFSCGCKQQSPTTTIPAVVLYNRTS